TKRSTVATLRNGRCSSPVRGPSLILAAVERRRMRWEGDPNPATDVSVVDSAAKDAPAGFLRAARASYRRPGGGQASAELRNGTARWRSSQDGSNEQMFGAK
ncbi:MAG: hypothetical protein WBW78_19040, partial [Terrimicrobiaceae bacterium]